MKLYSLASINILVMAASLTSTTTNRFTFRSRNLLDLNEGPGDSPSSQTRNQTFLQCSVYCNVTGSTEHTPHGCTKSVCRKCQCDQYCQTYGDCCDLNKNIRAEGQNRYECVGSKKGSHYFWGRYEAYYMMTKCPVGVSLDWLDASETLQDDVSPVTSVTTYITYLNDKISECHNDNIQVTWTKDRICENGTGSISEKICVFKIIPPDDLPVRECQDFRPSNLAYIDTCSSADLTKSTLRDAERACKNEPYQPVVADEHVFKNMHCYLCNGLSPFVAPCARLAIQVSDQSINTLVRTSCDDCRPVCKTTQWYDRLKNVCRYIMCRQGYELTGDQCVITAVSLPDVQYHVRAEFWPRVEGPPHPELQDWGFVKSMVAENILGVLTEFNISDYVFTVYNIALVKSEGIPKQMPSFRLRWTFRTKQNCCRDEFEQLLSILLNSWTYIYNGSRYTFDLSEENLQSYRITSSQTYKVTTPDKTGTDKANKENVYLPTIYPSCSFVFLLDDDFTWNSNESITLSYAAVKLQSVDFIKKYGHKLIVCLDTLKKVYKHYHYFDPLKYAENIVSLLFSILSLVCLTLTFLTYCSFPSLRTLPTENTMCLVVHLFVAQLLLQFKGLAAGDETTCKVIGVLLHYFWLSVVFWMNVCSFHMFHVFVINAAKPINSQSHRARQLQYFAYANGSSLIIVITTISAKLGTTSGVQLGYGSGTCYLSSALLRGVSFILPLGIILIMNIIFFSISVRTMAKIHKMTENIGHEKSHVDIYMKLSTLTGVFWVLSILAETLNLQVLVFISIILNASQGVFIFISYVLNRRVYRLWKCQFPQYAVFGRGQSTESTRSSRV